MVFQIGVNTKFLRTSAHYATPLWVIWLFKWLTAQPLYGSFGIKGISIRFYECVYSCLSYPASFMHCIIICVLSGCTIFFHLPHKWHDFWKHMCIYWTWNMSFDFLYRFCLKHLWAHSQNCEKRAVVLSCLSVLMEQPGSSWMDFHEIWYLSIFRKSVKKIQFSLKSDKNNEYFTWRQIYIYGHMSLSSPQNDKCFRQKF